MPALTMRALSSSLAAVLFLAAVSGCDKSDKKAAAPPSENVPRTNPDAPASTAPAPTTPEAPPPPAPGTPKIVAKHQAGPAYFGVDGAGLYQLVDGKITQLIAHEYPIHDIVVDTNGVVYATAIGGIWRIERGKVESLDNDAMMDLDKLTLGPDNVLWGTDRREVRRWEKTWTTEPATTFDAGLLSDIAVDHQGRTWVVETHHLYRLDGDAWTKIDGMFTGNKEPFFGAIAVGADGAVYVSCNPGLFVFRDNAWTEVQVTGDGYGMSLDELTAGPAGHVYGSGGVDEVVTIEPGEPAKRRQLAKITPKAHRGDMLAVDGQGRAWVTSDNGLVVLAANGDLLQQWLPGTVAGVSGAVTALAVVDDGPSLPELQAAVTGHIAGRILRGGKPVEGAAVQLCNSPLTMFQSVPCEDASFTAEAVTGADGAFLLQNVPVGTYGFAIKPDAQWRILIGSNCCNQLQAGETFDVGSVSVDG